MTKKSFKKAVVVNKKTSYHLASTNNPGFMSKLSTNPWATQPLQPYISLATEEYTSFPPADPPEMR